MARAKELAAKVADTTDIALRSATDLAIPDFLQEYSGPSGLEGLGREDFKLPVLKVLQGTSPETREFDEAEAGLFWATSTRQVLGQELFVTVASVKRRVTLWAPREMKAKRMLARSNDCVHWDKPNQEFEIRHKHAPNKPVIWKTKSSVQHSGLTNWGTSDPSNADSKPAAQESYEYLLVLNDYPELSPIVTRMYSSGLDTARNLNTMLRSLRVPMYGAKVKLNIIDKNSNGEEYFGLSFALAGYTERDIFAKAVDIADQYKDFVAESDDDEGDNPSATTTDYSEVTDI